MTLREATQNVIAYFGAEILDGPKAYVSAILDLLEMDAAESGVLISYCNEKFLTHYLQTAKNCNLNTLNDAYEMGVCHLKDTCFVREDIARSISLGITQGIADACGCVAFEPNESTQHGIAMYEAELDSTDDDVNDETLLQFDNPPACYQESTLYHYSMSLPDIRRIADDVVINHSDNRSNREAGDGKEEYQTALDLMKCHRGLPDYIKIINYLRTSRDKGYAKAYTALGNLYYRGFYLRVDYKKAYEYYMHAATNGHDPEAMYRLGLYFAEGIAVPKDYGEAKIWFERADSEKNNPLGHKEARFQLGKILFEGGHGIDKCLPDAIGYLNSAKEAKCKNAVNYIEAHGL